MRSPRVTLIGGACLIALAAPLWSQSTSEAADEGEGFDLELDELDDDFGDLSLEELLDIDVEVTSVSRKSESLSRVPAAVHVITAEDIRRAGVRSIPEALRMAPGIRVVRLSSGRYAVTSRGFTWEFSDKVLVLLDGRSVYSPLFSGTEWESIDLPVEEIERIEVIRGPGGTMWGANAVNGVINIITRSAKDDHDRSLTVVYGDEERRDVVLRGGMKLGEGSFLRAFARTNERDALSPNVTGIEDGFEQLRAGFRADIELDEGTELLLQANAYRIDLQEGLLLGALPPVFQRSVDRDQDRAGASLMGRWTKTHEGGAVSTLQGSFAYSDRESNYAIQDRSQADIFFTNQFRVGDRHDLIWGVSARHTNVDSVDSEVISWVTDRDDELFAGFVQDEITLSDELSLILGVKAEDNPFSGLEIQPSARIAYRPDQITTWWASASRAIQTPAEAFRDARLLLAVQPDMGSGFDTAIYFVPFEEDEPESVIAFEAGVRTRLSERATLEISAFYNDYDNGLVAAFGAATPVAPGLVEQDASFQAVADFRTVGVEVTSEVVLTENLAMRAAYSYIDFDESYADGFAGLPWEFDVGTPRHLAHLGVSYDVANDWELDTNLYYVSASGPPTDRLDGALRADLRAGWRPSDDLTVTLAAQGLFHDDERELETGSVTNAYGAQAGAFLGLQFRF